MKIQLLAVACMIPVAAYAAVGSSGNNQRSSINDIVSKVNSLKSGHDSDSRSRWDNITHEDDRIVSDVVRIVSDVQDGFTQINQVMNTNLTISDAKIQQALQDAYDYSDQKDADNKADIEATAKLLAQIEDRTLKNDLEDYIDSEIEKAKINGGGSGGGSSTPVMKTEKKYITLDPWDVKAETTFIKYYNLGKEFSEPVVLYTEYYTHQERSPCSAAKHSGNRIAITCHGESYRGVVKKRGRNDVYGTLYRVNAIKAMVSYKTPQ